MSVKISVPVLCDENGGFYGPDGALQTIGTDCIVIGVVQKPNTFQVPPNVGPLVDTLQVKDKDRGTLYLLLTSEEWLTLIQNAMNPGGGSVAPVETTYEVLKRLADNDELVVGRTYLITDYETIYDQPDYFYDAEANLGPKNPGTITVKTGDPEPIIVCAVSTSAISPYVSSTTHPTDKIVYDLYFTETEITATPTKGRIVERISAPADSNGGSFRGVRTDYDWREVIFKRYQDYAPRTDLSGTIAFSISPSDELEITGTGTSFSHDLIVGSIISFGRIPTSAGPYVYYGKVATITDDTHATLIWDANYPTPELSPGHKYYRAAPEGTFMSVAEVYPGQSDAADWDEYFTVDRSSDNVWIGNFANIGGGDFLLSNNVFQGKCNGIKTGHGAANNTAAYPCVGMTLGNAVYLNRFLKEVQYSQFGDDCFYNIFGQTAESTFGDGVGYNTFKNVFNSIFSNSVGGCKFPNMASVIFLGGVGGVDFDNLVGNGGPAFNSETIGLKYTVIDNVGKVVEPLQMFVEVTSAGNISVNENRWLISIAGKCANPGGDIVDIGTTFGGSEIASALPLSTTYTSINVNLYMEAPQIIYFTGTTGLCTFQLLVSGR